MSAILADSAIEVLKILIEEDKKQGNKLQGFLSEVFRSVARCHECRGHGFFLETIPRSDYKVRRLADGKFVYQYKCGVCHGTGQRLEQEHCSSCGHLYRLPAFKEQPIVTFGFELPLSTLCEICKESAENRFGLIQIAPVEPIKSKELTDQDKIEAAKKEADKETKKEEKKLGGKKK